MEDIEVSHRMRLTVRTHILLVSLAAILPLLVGQAYTLWERYTFARVQAAEDTREKAQAIAGAATAVLAALQQEARQAAGQLAQLDGRPAQQRAVLERLAATQFSPAAVAFVLSDGRLAQSAPETVAAGVASLPALDTLRSGAEWEPIDAVPDLLQGYGLAWGVAAAVRRSGRFLGAAVVLLPGRALERLVPVHIGAGSWHVTDRLGRIVYRSGDDATLTWQQRDRSDEAHVQRAIAGDANDASRFVGPAGILRLGAAVPVAPFGWAVVVSRPLEEVLAPARRQGGLGILIAVSGVALALVLSLLLGRRMTRPLARLLAGTDRVAHGQNQVLAPPEGPAEVADLTTSFNLMAQRLHERQRWDGAVKAIGALAASRRPLPEILDGGLAALMEATGANLGIIRLADPTGTHLNVAAPRNAPAAYLARYPTLPARRVPPEGMVLASLGEQPSASHWKELAGAAESLAYLPLRDQDRLVGSLTLGHAFRGCFRPETLEDLRPAASLLAGAILAEQFRAAAQQEAAEKHLLLRELDHRVRNNLAALIGLLNLGEDHLEGPAAERLRQMADRVQRLADVHDLLAGRWHQSIEVREVAELVAKNVLEALPAQDVAWSVAGNGTRIPPRQVTPLAMVLNELLTNAAKHAFQDRKGGRVDIRIAVDGPDIEIAVADNGTGRQAPARGRGLGMTIVHLLVERSLGGSVQFDTEGGTRARIRFPAPGAPEEAAR
jgi:two-component sensor histidine kinase/HAMP domain-containing protein